MKEDSGCRRFIRTHGTRRWLRSRTVRRTCRRSFRRGSGVSRWSLRGTEHFFIRFVDGKVAECRECAEAVPGKQLNYRIMGPAHVFEGVAAGIVDPVDAGLGGALQIRGDMRFLMQNAEMANVIFEIYKQSGLTDWPKGKPPYAGA
ncbi:MAG: SCP2 sterol-binding domain-containing protein [Deltaproteobacteria bacterium]|nr:SCP2 sterol-binding domain-containing protein [Deltaproteobacteria bacterium]